MKLTKIKLFKKLFLILTIGLLVFSCGNKNNQTSNSNQEKTEKTSNTNETLVTSIAPLKWIVQQIAGKDYNVISILQPNMNHELFEPKPDDLKTLENSKLFFTFNALNFEEKISGTISDKNKVINVLDNVNPSLLLENHDHDHEDEHKHEHEHEHEDENHEHEKEEHGHVHNEKFDPHVWFSLDLMPQIAENIKNKLTETYPDKKETFEKNYMLFINELNTLKKDIQAKMETKTKKYFLIYHPALNYFTKNYDIKEIAVEYEGKEPSAKQMQEIISEAKEHNITTILVQPQFSKQSIEIISKELPNAKILEFNTDEENIFENLRKFVNSLD